MAYVEVLGYYRRCEFTIGTIDRNQNTKTHNNLLKSTTMTTTKNNASSKTASTTQHLSKKVSTNSSKNVQKIDPPPLKKARSVPDSPRREMSHNNEVK